MLVTIGKIAICILSVLIIVLVLLQRPKDGAGAAFGGGDSFLSKTKSKTYEAKLDRYTKIAAVTLAVASFALVLIQKFAA
ncbi:MAG: preprotein translocase subunit SecG [Clostridiales bacterium]|nr:preprotein translocase subunit SecG [Clostridiales bacterium]